MLGFAGEQATSNSIRCLFIFELDWNFIELVPIDVSCLYLSNNDRPVHNVFIHFRLWALICSFYWYAKSLSKKTCVLGLWNVICLKSKLNFEYCIKQYRKTRNVDISPSSFNGFIYSEVARDWQISTITSKIRKDFNFF